MSQPDFLICMECESPCYVLEWKEGKPQDRICEACGNEDPDAFATQEDFDALMDS